MNANAQLNEKQFLTSLSEFLEYGEYEGHLYGLPFAEITKIIASGKIPVLDVEPTSLIKLRHTFGTLPLLAVYVKPPESIECGPLSKLQQESKQLEQQFQPVLDEFLTNFGDLEPLAQQIDQLLTANELRWMPSAWFYD